MKGFVILALFSIIYLLLMILLQAAAEPRGVGQEKINENSTPNESPLLATPHSEIKSNEEAPKVKTDGIETSEPLKTDPIPESQSEVHHKKPCNKNKNKTKTHQTRAEPPQPQQVQNSSNPIVEIFQVTDPNMKSALDAVYGSYAGDDQCMRKSFCIMGNYMKEMPGKELGFILLGGYISPAYSIYYDIFRNSALYGQNCNVYVCVPQNPEVPKSPPR